MMQIVAACTTQLCVDSPLFPFYGKRMKDLGDRRDDQGMHIPEDTRPEEAKLRLGQCAPRMVKLFYQCI